MQAAESYVNERLDHLGIVAGVCREIGLAVWLDEQDPTNRQQVSVRNCNDSYDSQWTGLQ